MTPNYCPTPMKVPYALRASAELTAAEMKSAHGVPDREIYMCQCGAFHVRRPLRSGQIKNSPEGSA